MALSRKQREIQEREELILDAARALLLERGYLGLTMDRIASAVEYSKGTVYHHFPNKEEVVMALVISTARIRAALFERAATFRGRPRERMLGVGIAAELFVQLYPDHFRAETVVRASSVREKTSPQRQRELQSCEHRCLGICVGLVRDGIAHGDLILPPGASINTIPYGLWSITFGVFTTMLGGFNIDDLGIEEPLHELRTNQHMLLDGYGFKPLSTEWDYAATYMRVVSEVFPDEWARLPDAPHEPGSQRNVDADTREATS
jgi:AcrR family transcriptional regulator